MICLACGNEQSNQLPKCGHCGHPFEVFPPFVRSNHVCQLQAALRRCQESDEAFEQFAQIYARFAELSLGFQERWRSGPDASLASSLSQPLKDQFLEGVQEMDQALGYLEEAMLCLDQALETDDRDGLAQADGLLTDFFKVGCGGCAALMDELEKEDPNQSTGLMLDVRGL